MTPPPKTIPATPSPDNSLLDALADALPAGYAFGVYHLSTPPTRCAALFPAPPGLRPDRTYQESHFLGVTIDHAGDALLAFALEVFVYSTAFSTTIFVSKADSSGCLPLLRLPRGAPSPVRAVAAAFLGYLVQHRCQRLQAPVQTVVSLFARAQAQYLFPRSVENPGKHVLDDRGLVRWWCRVLDPLVGGGDRRWANVHAYLTVPGLEPQEMRALLPKPKGGGGGSAPGWSLGHPLLHISHYVRERGADRVPPRCLVAQFPDDPKSRFRDELDDEAEARTVLPGRDQVDAAIAVAWKSVRTLDQFWEMMAFRQECSSGRMTGFVWMVFDPEVTEAPTVDTATAAATTGTEVPKTKTRKPARKKLHGRIVPRVPRIKTANRRDTADGGDDDDQGGPPLTTPHYTWPRAGRGARVLPAHDYRRAVELLLLLDFATRDKAARSTRRWVAEVGGGSGGGGDGADWGRAVRGRCAFAVAEALPPPSVDNTDTGVTGTRAAPANLTGLVKRKRAETAAAPPEAPPEAPATEPPAVRVLSSGLIRKKPKAG